MAWSMYALDSPPTRFHSYSSALYACTTPMPEMLLASTALMSPKDWRDSRYLRCTRVEKK